MNSAIAIAIAACAFSLPEQLQGNHVVIQVTPTGFFKPSDGRDLPVSAWHIDRPLAIQLIERFEERKTRTVVDYEHQTLHKETNGQPAPAAGWISSLEWKDESGLWATVELTPKAIEYVSNGEYLYFSPVFVYDSRTGDVLDLLMGALTNKPGIEGMAEIELLAAATFGLPHEETQPMKKLLIALGLAETATEGEAIAALNAQIKFGADIRKAIAVSETADSETVIAACTALHQGSGKPDPAKYVPIESVQQMQTDIAALTAKIKDRDDKDVDSLIKTAIDDGRLPKTLEPWARELGGKDVAALTAYLDKAQPIAALTSTQTKGKEPQVDQETGLTDAEMAVCTAMGLTVDAFKAANTNA
ncbi:Mu-like prophage I protein [Methylophaga frappieri]|uniref:Mu-like prophage I protein n=1 Tax=Methylophaga frappieri (strain ATCC BAA-2434 / DSM 25690 / JAM7) TaxID=754477 RepID=I1YGG0_METFJ|nr:phage protease [Methylophaga frappieri]AFJ02003.1 Mu-like prophage I protein [Methylophaga frappieri]